MSETAIPLVLVIEDAKNVLMNTVVTVKEQTGLPSSILDGILSGILADLRKDSCSEISLAAARERQELMKKDAKSEPKKEE
ncbi:hypothetical protein [Blautia sp.]|uniref:hypothetical protein n=1 Tax=Blautia sp. TaxID=1955243 RepID=UPI003AB4DEF9